MTRYTLPRAMADTTVRTLCQRLLHEGRPEWIVLMTLANLVMNYRMRRSRKPPMTASNGQWQTIAAAEMRREEQASDPSPPMTEIAETFEMHLSLVTATIARFWGQASAITLAESGRGDGEAGGAPTPRDYLRRTSCGIGAYSLSPPREGRLSMGG